MVGECRARPGGQGGVRGEGARVGVTEGADARAPVDGGQAVLPGGGIGDGQQLHEPVVDGVPVPDGLDRDDAAREACGAGREGVEVDRGVGGAGHPVPEVLVAGGDELLGRVQAEALRAARFPDGPYRVHQAVLEDEPVGLRADAGREALPLVAHADPSGTKMLTRYEVGWTRRPQNMSKRRCSGSVTLPSA